MQKAMLWEKTTGNQVQCKLCRQHCIISPGHRGLCRVRENKNGELYALTYGKPCSANPDPIEKKPLFHFMPGTRTFSIATAGCNFKCKHCQNHTISQASPEQVPSKTLTPEQVVHEAIHTGCQSIAYTYTEPTVFFEYAYAVSALAHEQGLKNIFVSNGYMTPEMIDKYDSLDAANIDIKGNDRFYKEVCGARLDGVLDSVKLLYEKGVHLEITNLIIPGYNDDKDSLLSIIEFIKDLDTSVPLHFSGFYPQYKMQDAEPTPRETLVKAHDLALEQGLNYVYCGNTYPGDPFENTYCPKCGKALIERQGYSIYSRITQNKCPSCGQELKMVF